MILSTQTPETQLSLIYCDIISYFHYDNTIIWYIIIFFNLINYTQWVTIFKLKGEPQAKCRMMFDIFPVLGSQSDIELLIATLKRLVLQVVW